MKTFVVNCGSSSIKYRLFEMTDESVLAKGVLERVGSEEATLSHAGGGADVERGVSAPDHTAGMRIILDALTDPDIGVLGEIGEIDAVGHRVVHGGEAMNRSRRIDEEVLRVIRGNFELSPLHNPPNLAGIDAAREAMPEATHVAVFDTAFFAEMPAKAYRYAVPERWYAEHHVRKYGFHGASHRYVAARAAELLRRDPGELNLITTHLGNGCSMTAVAGGRAVDHSMGMTPLPGLMMGTRSGDIDPAVLPYMIGRGLSAEQVDTALNKQSGLLGVSGRSNDMRDLLGAIDDGDKRAELAVEMFVYRIVKYVGAYHAAMGRTDALVLTGGIGENSVPVRARLCRALTGLGVTLDEPANERTVGGECGAISTDPSALPVWIVPTNEELMIARDTRDIVEGG